jgi:hypothetical protein
MHAEGTASSPFTLKAMCACCCYPMRRTTQRRGDWRGFEAAGRSSANCCRCNSATRFTNWLRVASDLSFGERNGMGAVGVRHDGRLKATGKKVKKGAKTRCELGVVMVDRMDVHSSPDSWSKRWTRWALATPSSLRNSIPISPHVSHSPFHFPLHYCSAATSGSVVLV